MVDILATKVGMTQIFQENGKLVPVTALNVNNWMIIRRKTAQHDGYNALVVGLLRKRYESKNFSADWLKKLSVYFYHMQEITTQDHDHADQAGHFINFTKLEAGQLFDASGITKGKGFQGVVKRHNFTGGVASHGSCLGRIPGSIGNHRSQGKVAKGKKLPGHMGCVKRTTQQLEIIKVHASEGIIFIKGSMPGFSGSVVSLTKSKGNL